MSLSTGTPRAEPSRRGTAPSAAPATLVSVVVPCYRQARFLGDALASVRAQTHTAVEIIVVDDGSPDDVPAALARHPDVQLVRTPHRGPSAARNAGLARARGDFVAFLDADDVLYPEALERGLGALAARPDCLFAAGGHTLTVAGALERTYVPTGDEPAYARMLRSNFILMHGAVLYRRAALDAVGGFRDEVLACEDMDLFLRLLRRGPVALHEHVVAEYRRHDANSSHESGRMFVGALAALRAQRPHVRGDPALEAAYAEGLAWGRLMYGEPVYTRLRQGLVRRDAREVMRALALLLRHDATHYGPRMLRFALRRLRGGPTTGCAPVPARVGDLVVSIEHGGGEPRPPSRRSGSRAEPDAP